MKLSEKKPSRSYKCGTRDQVTIHDCGDVHLDDNEQLTFKTEAGGEYDVTRKSWGFYATPSLNGRLPEFDLKGVLICSQHSGRYFVVLVEKGKEDKFKAYCDDDDLKVVLWLDDDANLKAIDQMIQKGAQ